MGAFLLYFNLKNSQLKILKIYYIGYEYFWQQEKSHEQ